LGGIADGNLIGGGVTLSSDFTTIYSYYTDAVCQNYIETVQYGVFERIHRISNAPVSQVGEVICPYAMAVL
jgi:hypothetical protein